MPSAGMPLSVNACSSTAPMPAGTSTEFLRYGTLATTSADGELLDSRGSRVCGAANG